MSGNVALDVVIGLVFIYLLYSLYATVVMEIVASFFGLRARNLCYAVSRMLMDEKQFQNPLKRIGARMLTTLSRVIGLSGNMKNPELYEAFFDQPAIKYLSSGGVGNRPSYLSAENFSQGLINALKNPDPEVGILARIEGGLAELPPDSETKLHLQSLLDEANNDIVKFTILLERWFDSTMLRATGWYKQTTQSILVVIGFTLVVSFNVDTLAIIKKLSKDENAREQLVRMATEYSRDNAGLLATLQQNDTTQTVGALNERLDSLQAIKGRLREDLVNSQNLLSSDWHLPDSLKFETRTRTAMHPDSLQISHVLEGTGEVFLTVHKAVDPILFKKALSDKIKDGKIKVRTVRYKLGYVFNFDRIWGYLLTVLALSLGAPFWFDLLNKLVKLRTSKAISSDSEAKSAVTGSSVSNRNLLNRAG